MKHIARHGVMVPLNMTYLHCLQHSMFEHLFNLYNDFALKSCAQQLLSSTLLFLYEYCSRGYTMLLHCSRGYTMLLHCSRGYTMLLHCSRGYTMLLHQTRNARNIKLT